MVFPLRPMVVSLRDYDDAENADPLPVNGYPVVCVTVRIYKKNVCIEQKNT